MDIGDDDGWPLQPFEPQERFHHTVRFNFRIDGPNDTVNTELFQVDDGFRLGTAPRLTSAALAAHFCEIAEVQAGNPSLSPEIVDCLKPSTLGFCEGFLNHVGWSDLLIAGWHGLLEWPLIPHNGCRCGR